MSNTDWKERDRKELAQRELLGQTAPQIATVLGAGWSVAPRKGDDVGPPHYVQLNGPNGAELGLSVGYPFDGKVCIAGHFKDRDAENHTFWYLPSGSARPSINASLTKGATLIARDVARRLLPDYLPLLASCNAAREERAKTVRSAAANAKILADLIGARPELNNDGYSFGINAYRSVKLAGEHFGLRVKEGEVRFDSLDVPLSVAVGILKILVANHKTPEE